MNELHRQKVLKLEYCFQMLNDTFILLSHIDYIVFLSLWYFIKHWIWFEKTGSNIFRFSLI